MGVASSILEWCGLARKVLRIVLGSLPDPANCPRCRADGAVCRPWLSAVCCHGPQVRRLPWIACSDKFVMAPYTGHNHRLPDNARCVGSTDDWLALGLGQEHTTEKGTKRHVVHKYVLHNPFSNTSLSLPELDAMVAHDRSLIRKFLMRSTVDDFIAVITNNRKHPLILFQRGKGVWSPKPPKYPYIYLTSPYIYLIDIAFLGDKLYAITTAEDLIPLDLALDGDGRPMVVMGARVIKKSPYFDYYESWNTSDEENEDHDDGRNKEEVQVEDEPQNGNEEEKHNGLTYTNINCSTVFDHDAGPGNITMISRHLIESDGKLLMVKHRQHLRPEGSWVTLKVDVLEADFSTHAWVPLTEGLGGGRALFVSMDFSKSVPAPYEEVEEDAIYFMDTGDVFNMKSGISSPSKICDDCGTTWLFPLEMVL